MLWKRKKKRESGEGEKPPIFRSKEYRYDLLLRQTRVGLTEISWRRMGSGNYFRNLVTVGLQITVANCVYNYNLRANQLRVTTARGVCAAEYVAAARRERRVALLLTSRSRALDAVRRKRKR